MCSHHIHMTNFWAERHGLANLFPDAAGMSAHLSQQTLNVRKQYGGRCNRWMIFPESQGTIKTVT